MKVRTILRNGSKARNSYFNSDRMVYGANPARKERADSRVDRFLQDALSRINTSTVNSIASSSVYGASYDKRQKCGSSVASENDLSLEQLQKQQEELMQMQNMIQEKMNHLQYAIKEKVSREKGLKRERSRTTENFKS